MSASSKKRIRKEQKAAAMTEKQLKEQKAAKSLKRYTLTFVVSMVLIVALVIGIVLYNPINRALDNNTVALTVGNSKLYTPMMSYFLTEEIDKVVSEYEETYGDYAFLYAGMNGLDFYKSLDDQMHPEQKDKTWGEVFVDSAVETASKILALYEAANKTGHKMTEDEELAVTSEINTMTFYALYYGGYSSLDSYLRSIFGSSASTETYTEFLNIKALAQSYSTKYFDELKFTDEDYRKHEKDDYFYYSSYDFSSYNVVVSDYREGGTKDEDGNVQYTDEQLAAALAAAKADAEALAAGKYKDSTAFDKAIAALKINADNEDVASTLYNDQFGGKVISNEDLREWLSDKDRKAGDVGMFPLTEKDKDEKEEIVGYNIVMFHSGSDNLMKLVNVRHILLKIDTTTDADGNTVFKEESKTAAEKEAKALLEEFKNGKFLTGESFGLLAKEHSDDGSARENGLIDEIYPGMTVEVFNDWCFDADRKVGDTDIILSDYGYHVMYFEGFCDMTYRDLLIDSELRDDATADWIDGLAEKIEVIVGDLSRLNTDRTLA